MSLAARKWAYGLNIKPSTAKFVLVTMADLVDERGLYFGDAETMRDLTGMDLKTVKKHLKTLEVLGLTERTGRKVGKTKSIPEYRLKLERSTNNGTAKPFQNWDDLEVEAVPVFPSSSTNISAKPTQIRATEQKGTEKKQKKAQPFVPPSIEEVTQYIQEIGSNIDPQAFFDYYETNGWVQGKSQKKVKNWKACVRTWERRQQARSASNNSIVADQFLNYGKGAV